jgi:hypothetical protein
LSGASTVARGSRVHYLARQTECSHKEKIRRAKGDNFYIITGSTYRQHSYLLILISISDHQITKQRVSTKIWSSSGHFETSNKVHLHVKWLDRDQILVEAFCFVI